MNPRASSLDLLLACPASHAEVEHPFNPDNPDANLGTAKHKAISRAVLGEDIGIDELAHEYQVPVDELDAAVGGARKLMREVLGWFEGAPKIFAELSLEWGEIKGTADAVLVWPDNIVVIDWKTGMSDDEHRAQLECYAMAAREKFHARPEDVTTTVEAQLRHGERIIRNYTGADRISFHERIAEAVDSPNRYSPGKHCRFCPARLVCVPHRDYVNSSAAVLVGNTDQRLSREKLGELYDRYKEVMRAARQYEKFLDDELKLGPIALPGGRQLALNEEQQETVTVEALAVLFEHFGITTDEIREAAVAEISKAGLERLAKSKAPPRGGLALFREYMAKIAEAGATGTKTRREKVITQVDKP